jgi:uncharacterized protein YaiI (UPF0178 family)
MALGKRALAINKNVIYYTEENIDMLMFERHISKKQRKSGNRTGSIKKRSKEDDENFESAFKLLCQKALKL